MTSKIVMFFQFLRPHSLDDNQPRGSGSIAQALLISLGLGCLLVLLWPGPSLLATVAVGLSGIAVGLFGFGFRHRHRHGTICWGLMIGGQLTAMLAIGLLFLVSLAA